MTIEALIVGTLHQPAEQRTAKTGKPFATAKVRAAAGDGQSVFVNVICFADPVRAALMAMDGGDSLALTGTLTPGAWIDRDGTARPSLSMVAASVMTLYAFTKKRAAIAQAGTNAAPDDDIAGGAL